MSDFPDLGVDNDELRAMHDHFVQKYKIIRFHRDSDNETLVRGLTLEQAQAHCNRDDTRGEGWFDGYTEDE